MESTLAPAEAGKVRISVRLDANEMNRAEDAAYRRVAKQVRLPGFRPGRAPRKVIEARLGAGYIRAEAIQDALPEFYQQAVLHHEVDVIAAPEIDITGGVEEGPVAFDAVVEVRPVVAADGYDRLSVEVPSPLPTDEEVQSLLDGLRAQFSELETVSRPARDTDQVTINVTGSQDGVEVEGLTVSDYGYEVGTGAVVPEIDENLRGAQACDILEFNASHPDPESESLLRFRILVKEVQARILPDLDDELVRSASEFETVDEFRNDAVERLGRQKRTRVAALLRERVSEAAADLVVVELSEALVAAEVDRGLEEFERALSNQGTTLEAYLAAGGVSEEEFRDSLRSDAERNVRLDLALRAVAEAEGLDVDDSELQAETERAAEAMELDPADVRGRLDRSGGWAALRATRRKALAMDWLVEHATVTDPTGAPIAHELLVEPQPAADEDHEADEADEDHTGDAEGSAAAEAPAASGDPEDSAGDHLDAGEESHSEAESVSSRRDVSARRRRRAAKPRAAKP